MSYDEHLISMAGGDGEPDALDLDAIQARADAATEGPWDCVGGDVVQSYEIAVRTAEYSLERVGIIQAEHVRENDTDFIAHARTDVPALLALVREQQAKLDHIRALADTAPSFMGFPDSGTVAVFALRAALTATEGA